MSLFRLASRLTPRVAGRTNALVVAQCSTSRFPVAAGAGASSSSSLRGAAASVAIFSTDTSRGCLPQAAPGVREPALHELGSPDRVYDDERIDKVADPERRAFTYLALSGVRLAYASAARLFVAKLVGTWSLNADLVATAFMDFDLSEMEVGKSVLVYWRGMPIYMRKRTKAEVKELRAVPMEHLRDQDLDEDRTVDPGLIIVQAICPHLGCVPLADQGDYDGFFCPCHGSHYDLSGRIRMGPSPLNLEIPPYKFLDEDTVVLG